MSFDEAKLNEMQQKAVSETEGPLLILAGAGSGKTRVLISRIAHLLSEKKASPYEVIAITFTNKAANEMKSRLDRLCAPGAHNVWASTFHSACAKILRRHIELIGYDSSFNIYDTSDSLSVIKQILKDLNIGEHFITPKTILSYISKAKGDGMFASDFIDSNNKHYDTRRRDIGRVYSEYEKRLKSSNSLDFDDLLLLTVHLFKKHPDVLDIYRNRFKYILVDEYQDTNHLQFLFTTALASRHNNICVVGDDDQSIYKFRGATIENILSFEKHFKNTKVIRLEQNYRSTSSILAAANDVISNNHGRMEKRLWTENSTGDRPLVHTTKDERAEAQFVAEKILSSVRKGRHWQDHVVLYRMNAQSNQFETAFRINNIPYKIFGGIGFYDRVEVKDMLSYLSVIHNPHDNVRLLRVINNPTRGIGNTTIERLRQIALDRGVSFFDAISFCDEYTEMKSSKAKLFAFADMINRLGDFADNIPLDALYDELLSASGYLDNLKKKKDDISQSRIENILELKTTIISFIHDGGETLEDFLSETALYTDLDRDNSETDKVMLMTMHGSKGLEFDTVFIVGAEEGVFPSSRSIDDNDIEEERRLCYVSMTRAMRKLFITNASSRMIFGRTFNSPASRFIGEIDSKNIDRSGDNLSVFHSAAFSFAARSSTSSGGGSNRSAGRSMGAQKGASKTSKPPVTDYKQGDNVSHSSFGDGVIVKVVPAGGDALLEVNFTEHGTKRLMRNTAGRYMEKV